MQKISFLLWATLLSAVLLHAQTSEGLKTQVVTANQKEKSVEENHVFRQKPNIAVLPFTNANAQAKEAEFGRTISSMLSTTLRSQTNFVVLERSELRHILTEQTLEMSGLTREKTKELSELYQVDVILMGDVSIINNTLHIDARLIETKSSKVVVALFGTCQDLPGIRTVVEKLAKDIEFEYLRQWMGSIAITSNPVGAEVYLENKFIGITEMQKPLKIDDLLEGSYNMRFICGGYFDWEGKVTVLSKMERSVKVSLIAKPGSMNINSEPDGAEIYLDNNLVGSTPMSLKKVAEGEHEIRLTKQNYKEWLQKVVVRSFQPTDVKAILKVSPGRLTINTEPSNATIFFKGQAIAQTPHTLSNIPPGEIVIRIEKAGFEERTTSVFIQPNKTEFVDIVLEEKVGTLNIISYPEEAVAWFQKDDQPDRKKIGNTPVLNYTTPIGNYRIDIEKKDYHKSSRNITVKHEQLTDVNLKLKEKPGEIIIKTNPPNASIFLDGYYKGRSPFRIGEVVKGDYEVTVRLPFAEETKKVSVEANRQSVVKANFTKSKQYILAITSIGVASLLFHFIAK